MAAEAHPISRECVPKMPPAIRCRMRNGVDPIRLNPMNARVRSNTPASRPPQKIAANGPLEKIFMFLSQERRLNLPSIGSAARRPQLLFRNARVFQQKSLHIGDDAAWVERSRTVDVPDATFPID